MAAERSISPIGKLFIPRPSTWREPARVGWSWSEATWNRPSAVPSTSKALNVLSRSSETSLISSSRASSGLGLIFPCKPRDCPSFEMRRLLKAMAPSCKLTRLFGSNCHSRFNTRSREGLNLRNVPALVNCVSASIRALLCVESWSRLNKRSRLVWSQIASTPRLVNPMVFPISCFLEYT